MSKYPESYNYRNYYDGFKEEESMPGPNLEKVLVKGGRERFLREED